MDEVLATAILEAYDSQYPKNYSALERRFGITRSRICKLLKSHNRLASNVSDPQFNRIKSGITTGVDNINPDDVGFSSDTNDCSFTENSDGSAAVTVTTTTPINRSLEDIIRVCKITNEYEIISYEVGSWSCAMRDNTVTNYKVSAKLRRRPPNEPDNDTILKAIEGLKTYRPPKINRRPGCKRTEVLAEINIVDAHWGKASYAEISGEDYNVPITSRIYRACVDELCDRIIDLRYNVDTIVYPVGHDILNSDNLKSETSNNTRVDMSADHRIAATAAIQSVVYGIEQCRKLGKHIIIPIISSNHSGLVDFYFGKILANRYWSDDNITVIDSPRPRQAVHWRGSDNSGILIVHLHGHRRGENPRDIAAMLPQEFSREFYHSKVREAHCGHYHSPRSSTVRPTITEDRLVTSHQGVVVRYLRSISGCDAWHYDNGFFGSQRAAEAFVYTDSNYICNLIAPVQY